jgi:energy-coupling factor transport system ATP-binding protein
MLTTDTPRRFFGNNSFYTTAANRMSRHVFSMAVTAEDVVELCRQNVEAEV